jgi:hypothetical protein
LSHSTSLFCGGFFQDRVLWTICLSWTVCWAVILLISASWITRITGMRCWHLAISVIFWIGSDVYAPTCLYCDPPISVSWLAGMTGTCYHAQLLLVEIRSCELFA